MEQTWIDAVRTLGLPVVMCLGMAYAMYRAAHFLAERFGVPLFEAHRDFLQAATRNADRMQDCLEGQGTTLDALKENSVKQTQLLQDIRGLKS